MHCLTVTLAQKKCNEHGQAITRGKPMLKVRSAVRTETGVRQATNTALLSEIVGSECSRAQQIAADTEALGDNLVSARFPRGFQRRYGNCQRTSAK